MRPSKKNTLNLWKISKNIRKNRLANQPPNSRDKKMNETNKMINDKNIAIIQTDENAQDQSHSKGR